MGIALWCVILLTLLAAAAAGAGLWARLTGRPLPTAALFQAAPLAMPEDPGAIAAHPKPNRAVACGPGLCPADTEPAPIPVPVFLLPPADLADTMRRVIAAQPRTALVAEDSDGLGLTAVQRTAVLGFPDTVRVWVRPVAAEPGETPTPGAQGTGSLSTLALLSRSRYGYWDLGVNERRLREWLTALSAQVGSADEKP